MKFLTEQFGIGLVYFLPQRNMRRPALDDRAAQFFLDGKGGMVMQEILRQYGNAILAVVAAGLLIGIFAAVMAGPLSDMFLFYTGSFLSA